MSIRTNYEKWYEGDAYYWGLEPGRFLEELIELCPPSADKKVLDIGCGEGKDAVYMAQKGYDVTAFDLTENGIRKTVSLSEKRNVNINAYVDDINTFRTDEQFDIIYSTGTVQYLFEENKKGFFEKLDKITKKNGIVYINVFSVHKHRKLVRDVSLRPLGSLRLFTQLSFTKTHLSKIIAEWFSAALPFRFCEAKSH